MGVNDEHFRVARHLGGCRVHVELAEHSADRHVHGRRDLRLLLEEQHPVLETGSAHLLTGALIEASGEIDSAHLCAESRRKWGDANRAADGGSRCVGRSKHQFSPRMDILARC